MDTLSNVLLKMADAAAVFFSQRYLPARTDPPTDSIMAMPNTSAVMGIMRLTAASAVTQT